MQVTCPTVTSRSAHRAAGYSAWRPGDLSPHGRQGHRNTVGWSAPVYLDEEYPFPVSPPYIDSDKNEVGSYRTNFQCPSFWKGRDVFIKFGSVRSAFYLWINGQKVGYSQGSKTPAEFDITEYVKKGNNSVSVEVYKFSVDHCILILI